MIGAAPLGEGLPLRTPTLPPATHTNSWLVGEGRLTVFDPASPWDDEQQALLTHLLERERRGEVVERIVLTHHHGDHVGGAVALQAALRGAGHDVPIAAHPANDALLAGRITIDEHLDDDQVLDCGGRRLRALFTPGHAPGHLAFLDEDSRQVIAGDLVAAVGTIVIAPHEGDLGLYLASLARVAALAPSALLPAHGHVLTDAQGVIAFYVAHRHQRSHQIAEALARHGTSSPDELVAHVYPDLPATSRGLAAGQILSHLRWMARHGLAVDQGGEARWSRN